jgi:hypothetical protein
VLSLSFQGRFFIT